jgi:hypothetical protein
MMQRPFMFTNGHFKVVVFATGPRKAREHVKQQGWSSLAWRALRYIGEGQPPEAERAQWLASSVRSI